ncbi:MAG: L-threonylcarbamoyladenylate synthase [Cyanobacteria bacterium]|nr:L-threonylcarbamoyladenylate synthase [Cyanobacteriota bacterium]
MENSNNEMASYPSEALLEILEAGKPVAFPTDTLPALAIKPQYAQRLWQLKQRPAHKPLILMAAEVDQLIAALMIPPPPGWQALVDKGWPGALTLVLPAAGPVQEALNPGGGSLGLRIPASSRALEFLRRSGPLATTSANYSGEPACTSPEQISLLFPELPLLAPLPWPSGSGKASTVVAWRSEIGAGVCSWNVVRQGSLQLNGLEK